LDLITKYRFTHKGKTFEKGFVGGFLGHWAVWTRTAVELFERIKHFSGGSEEYKALLTLAVEITDANAAFFDSANGFSGCIAGLHEVLRRQGLLEGIWCLNRDECLSVGQLQEINRIYSMYPHLNDDEFVKNNMKNWL